jgi:hypothetical protein
MPRGVPEMRKVNGSEEDQAEDSPTLRQSLIDDCVIMRRGGL